MPSSSSARMTRTAISPRLATRTFANMRREDYLVATATSRSVADRAAAVGAGALEHDDVDGGATPPPDPPPGGRVRPVRAAGRPAAPGEDLGEPLMVGWRAPGHRRDVGLGAGAQGFAVPH